MALTHPNTAPSPPSQRPLNLRLWPPNPATRSSLVDRISSHLSSVSFFSQKYGLIGPAQASSHAKRIEESAFQLASQQQHGGSSDISVVQYYAKEASKLMLECLKLGPSPKTVDDEAVPLPSETPDPVPAASETTAVEAAVMQAVFDVSGGKREFLTKEAAEELLKPLSVPGNAYTSICLSNRSFGEDAAKVAEQYLINLKGQLRDVNLADIVAGRPEAEALSVMSIFSLALEGCNLKSLNLSDNALGEKGVRAFSALLKSQNALEELYFINDGISEEAAAAICELLPSPEKLRILHFHNNMSGNEGALALSKLVRNALVLEDFRFSSTRVETEGGSALAEALLVGSSLKRIDLRDNPFGPEVGRALANTLQQHLGLTEVYLSDLGLEDNGAKAVLRALMAGAPGLKILELAGNEITEQAADILSDCIASKSTLIKLNLSENELKDKGVVTVCKALVNGNESLAELDLSTNYFGRIGASAAAKAVATKPGFKLLNINGNHISEAGIDAVKEELRKGVCGISVLGSMDENEEDEDEDDYEDEGEEDEENNLETKLSSLKM